MSIEETRRVVEHYLANRHEMADCLHEGCVFQNMSSGQTFVGKEAVMQMLHETYDVAFPDGHVGINSIFADPERVCVEMTFHGTNKGPIGDASPTFQQVVADLCVVYEVENSQIVGARIYQDTASITRQLGAESQEAHA